MIGYLMRLAMRGRETSAMQSMQPSVRTSSPVAEYDQRIGIMGFEGFEFGEASVAERGLEAGVEQELRRRAARCRHRHRRRIADVRAARGVRGPRVDGVRAGGRRP